MGRIVKDNVSGWAKHKCGSNVVETCLEIATIGEHSHALEKERAELVKAILDGKPAPIHDMFCDRYGHYIVYRMLEHCNVIEKATLLKIINESKEALKQSCIGKSIGSCVRCA